MAWAQPGFAVPGVRGFGPRKHTRARLVLSHEAAKPGDTVMAGVELMMDPGWHTYWKNPGGPGQETELHWNFPAGISADEIQWPTPEKFTTPDKLQLTTYVYHERAVLLVPVKIPANAPAGELDLAALVKWLECEVVCIPGSNIVRGSLLITNEAKLSSDTNFFAEAQKRLPSKEVPGNATAKWDAPGTVTNRAFLIEWNADANEPDFFPFTNSAATIADKTKVVANAAGKVVLSKSAERTGGAWPKEISGLLVRKENGALRGYEVSLPLSDSAPVAIGNTKAAGSVSFLVRLLYAFLGGLILNVMPCVLPVIALKILGFVNQSREHPRRVRTLGLLYTLGVIASFIVLAGLVIGLKAAGQKVGWGMQFSNPQFIVILALIVTLVALNLFGLFEVTLAGGAMNAAGAVASRHGTAGAFMNGVLAVALATPCLAPFLGGAVGFALSQPAHVIVIFFVVIALGMALPYLLLSWNPTWLKFLPKPGPWMERFKVAMGFPMLATALWLVSLTTTFYGERSWWLGVFLVFAGAAAWIFGTFVQRGGARRGLAIVIAFALIGLGYAWALESELRWRSPETNSETTQVLAHAPEGYSWQRWSPEAVARARAEGRPVVVDFTAKWCLTCNITVKPAFESQRVIEKMKALNAAALVADYTTYPSDIADELARFERSGVPLVLVYPADANKPPLVLAEPLPYPAPYGSVILDALAKAAP
jgi:thiol:disulfide interchange protein DsbD